MAPKKNIEKLATPINLFEYQIGHKNTLELILDAKPVALDLSMLGTGKTFTSSKIFIDNPTKYKHLVVISPVSVKAKWKQMIKDHDLNIYKNISYCELRSAKFKQPKHGLLHRKDYVDKVEHRDGSIRDMEKVKFSSTQTYKDLVKEGVLLVIDEIQNLKNYNDQFLACAELIREIVDNFKTTTSRVLLLSGSPIDKFQQAVRFYKTIGVMRHDKLSVFNPQTWNMMWRGMNEIHDYHMNNFNPTDVQKVYRSFGNGGPRDRELERYCYRLFIDIYKKYCSSSMSPPKHTTTLFKRNAFYSLGDEVHIDLLKNAVGNLKKVTNFNGDQVDLHAGGNTIDALRRITSALIMIETAKIPIFTRVAQSTLDQNYKVVICVNYQATVDDLVDLLSDYAPLKMCGSMSAKQRCDVISKFQADTDEYKLLIGNVSVLSTGIDLDDKSGKFPRLCLVSPNYSIITLYQLSHRFQRANTKSDATIHFVFGKEATELPILNALAKKSETMKEVCDAQAKAGIIFPGDYEKWEEV
jgi:hypothetical protein